MIRHRESRSAIIDTGNHLYKSATPSSSQHLSRTKLDRFEKGLSVRCVTNYGYVMHPCRQRTPETTSFCSV